MTVIDRKKMVRQRRKVIILLGHSTFLTHCQVNSQSIEFDSMILKASDHQIQHFFIFYRHSKIDDNHSEMFLTDLLLVSS